MTATARRRRQLRGMCAGDFEAQLLRTEFGSTYGLPSLGDRVRLLIAIEGVRLDP